MGVHPPQNGGIGYDPLLHLPFEVSRIAKQTSLPSCQASYSALTGNVLMKGFCRNSGNSLLHVASFLFLGFVP